jgi:glutamine synthetase
VQSLLTEIINDHSAIVFNGDGYSQEWHDEAAERGLLNLRTTADALPYLKTAETLEMFEKYGVLSERELESRQETYFEQYCLTVDVEANLACSMARKLIFPAAVRYQNELAATCANLKLVGIEFDTDTLDSVTALVKGLQDSIVRLEAATAEDLDCSAFEEARHRCDVVLPAMLDVRGYVDQLESVVADDLWPLPTYQEMLFIK